MTLCLGEQPALAKDVGKPAVGVGATEDVRAAPQQRARLGIGGAGLGEEAAHARDAAEAEERIDPAFLIPRAGERAQAGAEVAVRSREVAGESARASHGPQDEARGGMVRVTLGGGEQRAEFLEAAGIKPFSPVDERGLKREEFPQTSIRASGGGAGGAHGPARGSDLSQAAGAPGQSEMGGRDQIPLSAGQGLQRGTVVGLGPAEISLGALGLGADEEGFPAQGGGEHAGEEARGTVRAACLEQAASVLEA